MTDAILALLILLAGVDWVATAILVAGARGRDPREPALDERAAAAVILSLGASAIAALAVSYFIHYTPPEGLGFALVVIALVAISLPQLVWVVAYWRGRFQ